ncbi:putative inner membrane protein [Chlamydia psittaci CP3]|nr:putative inner membrane protein [Chlamydia psittaci CP3]
MTSNKNYPLIYLPGILWLLGGIKLLLKASMIVYQPDFSFKILVLLAMGAWFVASLKYRFLLLKSVSAQNDLSNQLLLGNISKKFT